MTFDDLCEELGRKVHQGECGTVLIEKDRADELWQASKSNPNGHPAASQIRHLMVFVVGSLCDMGLVQIDEEPEPRKPLPVYSFSNTTLAIDPSRLTTSWRGQ